MIHINLIKNDCKSRTYVIGSLSEQKEKFGRTYTEMVLFWYDRGLQSVAVRADNLVVYGLCAGNIVEAELEFQTKKLRSGKFVNDIIVRSMVAVEDSCSEPLQEAVIKNFFKTNVY